MISVHMTTARRYRSGLLEAAVDSVLSQSYPDLELVICDDASHDGTGGYLAEVAARDARVRVIRNEHNVNSVAISLGRCLQASDPSRPWVTWMFDDCRLRPNAFADLVARAERETGLDMVFGTTVVHKHRGAPLLVGHLSPEQIWSGIDRNATLVPNAGILVRRELFDGVGWFDSNVLLRRSCDWEWFRRAIRGGARYQPTGQVACDEFGEQQPDSLRNTYTTDFRLMSKYAMLRAEAGWDLSLDSMLHHPVDRIPFGSWTPTELRLCDYIALEYFLSVGDLDRALVWAQRLATRLGPLPFYVQELEERALDDPEARALFCGLVWGTYQMDGQPRHDPLDLPQTIELLQRVDAAMATSQPTAHRLARRGWVAVRPVVLRSLRRRRHRTRAAGR
jgi:hypothetical protein